MSLYAVPKAERNGTEAVRNGMERNGTEAVPYSVKVNHHKKG